MGVAGITITDHADMNFYESWDTYNRIKNDIAQIRQAQEAFVGKLEVICGVELGEYLYAYEKTEICDDFDIAMQSLKAVGFIHYHYYKSRKSHAIDL